MNESSVFSNVYLSKYEELKQYERHDRYSVSFRVLITYLQTVTSSFRWKNVENVPYFMPEHFLLYSGRLGVFMHEGKPVIYPAYPTGALMPDGEYSRYDAIFPDGKTVNLKREDVTIIFGNSLKAPTYGIIADFANRSSFALCAVDSALKRAILPPMVAVDNEDQLKAILEVETPEKLLSTICAMYKDKTFGDKNGIQRVPIFDNRETDVLSLWDVFSRYDRMFYRTFGISTVGIQKNERLTEAESTGEEEMTRYTLFQDMYNCRKFGIEQANEKFGSNFEIEIMRDDKSVYELSMDNDKKIELREIEASRGSNVQPKEGEDNGSAETSET